MQARLTSILLFAALAFAACRQEITEPTIVGPEPEPYRVERDSIETGSYLGIAIGETAEAVYPKIQEIQLSKGQTWMNVVSNISSDLTQLRDRIPLYEYILLDQSQGTDSGVQITIKGANVSAIYLNSGKKINQWPEKEKASASVQTGEHINALFGKLTTIRGNKSYAAKFERIFLMTKNLATPYDPATAQSPQWYFGFATSETSSDQIQVLFESGKVKKIRIEHYLKY